ncbi:hypothetical protein FNI11_02255 [Salmonella enterica subsp. salamae]|nr:hypothetical protein [Salmonella enterica subsp. salamae]ECJ2279749.1 hypothetical protein [Salmonella enterica subsp. salamae]HCC0887427.1 hypothetical protein [Salmonella enterica]
MNTMRRVIPVLLLSFIVYEGKAEPTAQIHFIGSVVEAGCWNDVGTLEIQCHKKDGIERYIIVENLATPIASPHAVVNQRYLDEDKQLTLLRIVYD